MFLGWKNIIKSEIEPYKRYRFIFRITRGKSLRRVKDLIINIEKRWKSRIYAVLKRKNLKTRKIIENIKIKPNYFDK